MKVLRRVMCAQTSRHRPGHENYEDYPQHASDDSTVSKDLKHIIVCLKYGIGAVSLSIARKRRREAT